MVENSSITIVAKATLAESNGSPFLNLKDLKVSGSPVHEVYLKKTAYKEVLENDHKAYNKRGENIMNQINQAYKEKDTSRVKELRKTPAYQTFEAEETAFFNKVNTMTNNLIESNKNSFWGPFLMLNSMSYFTPEQKPMFESFSKAAKASYYGQLVQEELFPKGFLGQPAPEVDAATNTNVNADLKSLVKGHKYILVDFWASWCAPCRKALPVLKDLYTEFNSKGLAVVSISIDKKKADWTKAEAEEQLKWPSFLDNGTTANAWKIKAIPAMFLLDENGVVVGENLTFDQIRAKLK